MAKKSSSSRRFDKYDFYQRSVQSPAYDVQLFEKWYQYFNKQKGKVLREDFCGTHAICCEWVKRDSSNVAYGLDLDPDPLMWGYRYNQALLTESQKQRLIIAQGNVLVADIPKTDIVVALNFSYFIFKKRQELLTYFKNVRSTLNKKGLFILDAFGGTQCQGSITDTKKVGDFTYYWEQKNFDPLSSQAKFAIHFEYQKKLHKNVFTYDWRLWTLAELKDLLIEAGFSDAHIFWEGTDKKGNGNGKFSLKKSVQESCESWIAYVVAER